MIRGKADLAQKISFRFIFCIIFLAALGGFELFKEGGARPQGLDNLVEEQGLLKYVNHLWVFCAFFAIAFHFIKNRWRMPKRFAKDPAWCFFFLIIFSLLWHFLAGTEYFFGILRAAVPVIAATIFVMLLPSVLAFRVLLKDLYLMFFLCAVLSLSLSVFVPTFGIDVEGRGWQGMFNHKNQLGLFCVLMASISLIGINRYRLYSVVNFILALFLVLASGSYTAIGVVFFVVLAAFAPGFMKSFILRRRFSVVFLVGALIAIVVSTSIFGGSSDFDIYGKDLTFTGRDKIWMYALNSMKDSYFGYGLNSIALQNELDPIPFREATGQVLGSAHNGFINLYYDFGVLGCASIVLLIFIFLVRIKSTREYYGFFIFLVALLLSNAFESKLLGFNAFYLLLILFSSYLGGQSRRTAVL